MAGARIDLAQTTGVLHSRTIESRIAVANRTNARRRFRILSIIPCTLLTETVELRSKDSRGRLSPHKPACQNPMML